MKGLLLVLVGLGLLAVVMPALAVIQVPGFNTITLPDGRVIYIPVEQGLSFRPMPYPYPTFVPQPVPPCIYDYAWGCQRPPYRPPLCYHWYNTKYAWHPCLWR